MVTWESYGQDGDGFGIFGQVYNAAGATIGAEVQISTYWAGDQVKPSVAALADGGFVVVWASAFQDGTASSIFGQRYDANGQQLETEIQINTYTTSYQDNPAVAAMADGGFMVTWTSLDQDGSSSGVFGQQFAAQLFGTSADDVIEDVVGADWLCGEGGNDTLRGLGGRDKILGGYNADILLGGKNRDVLKGGRGTDTLNGGKGKDILVGGKGEDIFIFKNGYGWDKITDFQDDIDTLYLAENLWGGGLTKQQVVDTYASIDGSNIVFDFGSDRLTLKGFTDLSELRDDLTLI